MRDLNSRSGYGNATRLMQEYTEGVKARFFNQETTGSLFEWFIEPETAMSFNDYVWVCAMYYGACDDASRMGMEKLLWPEGRR